MRTQISAPGYTTRTQGLTVVEVMVCVLIVGVLATLGVGGYKRHIARTVVQEAITAAIPLQQVIQDYYQNSGIMPGRKDLASTAPQGYTTTSRTFIANPITDVAEIAYRNPTDYCTVGDDNCDGTGSTQRRQIEITFSDPTSMGTTYLSGKIFILRANLSAGGVNWYCRTFDSTPVTAQLDSTLLPKGCSG